MQQNIHQNVDSLGVKEKSSICPDCPKTYCCRCDLVFRFFLMLLIWATIALSIIVNYTFLLTPIPLYIYFIICEFYTHKDLFKDQKSPQEIKDIIGKYFTSPGSIQFIRRIYIESTRKDKEGNEETYDELDDIESEDLQILSSRDVSGVLNFNAGGYSYVSLHIDTEVQFADTISYKDFLEQEKKFKKETKEIHFRPRESVKVYVERGVSGFGSKNDYLVNIYNRNNNQSCFLSRGTYIAFVLLALAPIYEIIILYCIFKNISFTIRKLVSTRYDLSNDTKYDLFNPKLVFPKSQFDFIKEDISHFDKKIKVLPPTQEELANSMKYHDNIPDYRIYQGNNKNLAGSVFNAKNYNNYQNFHNYGTNVSNIIPLKVKVNQGINNINDIYNETNNNFNINQNRENLFEKNSKK